jgi:hypothetical protein
MLTEFIDGFQIVLNGLREHNVNGLGECKI